MQIFVSTHNQLVFYDLSKKKAIQTLALDVSLPIRALTASRVGCEVSFVILRILMYFMFRYRCVCSIMLVQVAVLSDRSILFIKLKSTVPASISTQIVCLDGPVLSWMEYHRVECSVTMRSLDWASNGDFVAAGDALCIWNTQVSPLITESTMGNFRWSQTHHILFSFQIKVFSALAHSHSLQNLSHSHGRCSILSGWTICCCLFTRMLGLYLFNPLA